MDRRMDTLIDIEAVEALIAWKSLFADQVALRARELAGKSQHPQRVTLAHYRQAAQMAMRSLSAAISDGENSDEGQKAA